MSLSEVPNAENTIIQPEQGGEEHRFRILKKLGAGGMGDVYLAEDTALKRKVAIKTIRPELCKVDEIRKRIERECVMHAKIGSHPHIVALYDRLEQNGQINLIMEYVEGEDLQALLQKHADEGSRLPWRDGIRIAAQTLEALARIHAQGIVHRDIKPSNILITRDDSGDRCAKLMDFGIARTQVDEEHMTALTREGTGGPGTPLYMAPEQIDPSTFGAISQATDVYAMGVMLYQIVSGHPPFIGSLTEIYNGHLNQQPPPLTDTGARIPLAFVELLRKALAKKPSERLASAKLFRDELIKILDVADKGEGFDMGRTVPVAALDPSRTVVATGAGQSAISAASGSTVLDTGTGTRPRKKGKQGVRTVLILLVLILAGAATLVAVGGYVVYTKFFVSETQGADPAEPGETTADVTPEIATPEPSLPLADTSTPTTDSSVPAEGTLPTDLPTDGTVPAAFPVDTSGTPAAPDALATTTPPATGTPVTDSGGSAMDALMQRLAESPPDAPVAPPVVEPPKQDTTSRPKPPPVEKPAVEPVKETEPPVKADPPPAEEEDDWVVIRKEDRKVD